MSRSPYTAGGNPHRSGVPIKSPLHIFVKKRKLDVFLSLAGPKRGYAMLLSEPDRKGS